MLVHETADRLPRRRLHEPGSPLSACSVKNRDEVAFAQAQDDVDLAGLGWAERHLAVPERLRRDEESSVMGASHEVSGLTRTGL
jgi:hypothetical protein